MIDTGGRQAFRIRQRRRAGKLALREAGVERLIGGDGRVDGAVRNSRRDRCSADRAQQPALKCLRVRRIHAHQIDHAARQKVAEQAEPAAQHRLRRDLPGDRGSRLQNRQRRRRENVPEMRLDHRVERLIHVVRNRVERARQPRHGVVRIQRIRIVRSADAEGPGQRARHLPGVLRVEIQIEEVVRLRIRQRKCLRRGRRNAVDELRQGRVGDQRNHAFAEIIIVQPEDPAVGSEAKFVRADGPRQIVVDEEARGAPALHPRVVEPAERRERSVRAAALEHDRKRRQRLLRSRLDRTGSRTRRTRD